MNIGYVFDNPNLIKFFKSKGSHKFFEIIHTDILNNKNTKPSELKIGKDKIDLIMVYIHAGKNERSMNVGLHWFKDFRMIGYITPAVLLTWQNCDKLQDENLRQNPFIGVMCKDSCTILRLPLFLDSMLNVSKKLKPINNDILETAAFDTLFFDLNHFLRSNQSMNDIKKFLKTEKKYFNVNKRYKDILEDLLNLKSIEELSNYKNKLKIFN